MVEHSDEGEQGQDELLSGEGGEVSLCKELAKAVLSQLLEDELGDERHVEGGVAGYC